jgi:uncharacterized protein YjiS (DUF1127 family)
MLRLWPKHFGAARRHGAAMTTFMLWLRRSITRRHLRRLEDHRLADVGLSEKDRRRECGKWFWQP